MGLLGVSRHAQSRNIININRCKNLSCNMLSLSTPVFTLNHLRFLILPLILILNEFVLQYIETRVIAGITC